MIQQIIIDEDVKIIGIIIERENKDIEAEAAKGIELEELKQAIERLYLNVRTIEERKN